MNKLCMICASKDIQCLFEEKSHYMFRCRNCGVVYQFPRDDREQYLKKLCWHYRFVDPSFEVTRSREILYKRFLNHIKKIKKIDSKILDIGCGEGYFLSLAKRYGWDAYGVEIEPEHAERAVQNYRLNIQNSEFGKAVFPHSYFDVITLWNTFGEFLNPKESLLKIKRILKPDGILFVRTPNAIFHLLVYKLSRYFKKFHLEKIMPKQSFIFHIFTLSNKSFRLLLTDTGFDNTKIKNSPISMGDPYHSGKGAKIFKKFSFSAAQFLYMLSCGKLILASSIEVWAKNKKS